MAERLTDINVMFHRGTTKAVLVSDNGNSEDGVWLPRALIELDKEDPLYGETITVTLSERLAQEKGLI